MNLYLTMTSHTATAAQNVSRESKDSLERCSDTCGIEFIQMYPRDLSSSLVCSLLASLLVLKNDQTTWSESLQAWKPLKLETIRHFSSAFSCICICECAPLCPPHLSCQLGTEWVRMTWNQCRRRGVAWDAVPESMVEYISPNSILLHDESSVHQLRPSTVW